MPDDGGVDEELAPSASSKFYLNNAPYTARIKRMMQSDEDVGRVAKATPILISKALDVFLANLVEGAVRLAQERGAKALTAAHMKAHIQSDPLLDFCLEAVAGVADLPSLEECALQSPKASRKRAKPSDKEAGEGRRQTKTTAQPAKQAKQEAGGSAGGAAAAPPGPNDGDAEGAAAPVAPVELTAEGPASAVPREAEQSSNGAGGPTEAPSTEAAVIASGGEGLVQPAVPAAEPAAPAAEPAAPAAEPAAAPAAGEREGSPEAPGSQDEFIGHAPGSVDGGGGGVAPGLGDDEEDYDDDG